IVDARLEFFEPLAFRRALLARGGLGRDRVAFGLLRSLLRSRHVIQLRRYRAQLALHLADRGIRHGLLRGQMTNEKLLPVAVTESYPGHNDESNDSHEQPPIGTEGCKPRFLAAFIFFEMFRHRFSPQSRTLGVRPARSNHRSPVGTNLARLHVLVSILVHRRNSPVFSEAIEAPSAEKAARC